MNGKYVITLLFALLAGIVIGWLLHRPGATVRTVKYTKYVPVHDTVIVERDRWRVHRVHDTVVTTPAVVVRKDTFFVTKDLVAVFDTVEVSLVSDSVQLDHRIAVEGGGFRDTTVYVRDPVPVPVYVDRPDSSTSPVAAPARMLPPSRMITATLSTGDVSVMGWWGRTVTAGGGISYDYEWKKAVPIIGIGVRW